MKLSDRELLLVSHAAACAASRYTRSVDTTVETVLSFFLQSEETFQGEECDVLIANIKAHLSKTAGEKSDA